MAYKIDLSIKKNNYASAIGSSYTRGTPSITSPFEVLFDEFDHEFSITVVNPINGKTAYVKLNPTNYEDSKMKIMIFSQWPASAGTSLMPGQYKSYIGVYVIFNDRNKPYGTWQKTSKNFNQTSPETSSESMSNDFFSGYRWSTYTLVDHFQSTSTFIASGTPFLNHISQPTVNIPYDSYSLNYPWESSNYAKMIVYSLANGVTPEEVDIDDPYDGIPDSGPDGGGGDFDDSSDPIDFPSLPAVSVADSGMCTIYKPSLADLQALNTYLWEPSSSGGIDESAFKEHMKSNIMECFMGLSLIPCIVPATNNKTLKIGNITTSFSYPVVDNQFVDVDMGTLTIKTGTGDTYLDYSPYTKAQIYLPFIGFQDLNVDEIMNKTLTLKYRFDVVSGGCVAFLKCGSSVLYQFAGNCQLSIPLTGADYMQVVSSSLSSVMHVGEVVAGGAAAIGGGPTPVGMAGVAAVVDGMAGLAKDSMASKINYTRSGTVSGNNGIMSYHYAYIVLTRPNVIKPKSQYKLMGYPSYIFKTCAELTGKGFTSFSELKMDGVTLTQAEKDELAGILKGGVYL